MFVRGGHLSSHFLRKAPRICLSDFNDLNQLGRQRDFLVFDGLISNSNTPKEFSNNIPGFILDKDTLCRKIKKLLNLTKSKIDPIQPPILPPI